MSASQELYQQTLASGVQVVGQPMPSVQSAAVGILIGAGAADESADQLGVTHFTEQMLFRGTEHFDARQLSERLDSLGVSHDTSAGLEMSLVSAVLLGDHLPAVLELLAEVVQFASFPADAIDNVRSVLLQELRQRDDQPAQRVMDTVRQEFFAGSPASHDVLGSEATVSNLGRGELLDYWRDRYTANNMVISIAGHFDWPSVVQQLERLTSAWPHGRGRVRMDRPTPHSAVKALQGDKSQEHLGFAFSGVSVADRRYYAAALFSVILGGTSTSRLFQEVREKRGLAYAVQSRFDGLQSTGLMRIYVGTQAERAHESVDVILAELQKLEESGIEEDELRLAKTRLKSQLVMRSESTSARMVSNMRSWWFEDRLRTLDEVRAEIDAVSVEQVSELVKELGITRTLVAVGLGPRSEIELFSGLLASPTGSI